MGLLRILGAKQAGDKESFHSEYCARNELERYEVRRVLKDNNLNLFSSSTLLNLGTDDIRPV